jgi:putative glutamine amidotransferase
MRIGLIGSTVGPNSFGVGISYVSFVQESLDCDDLRILTPRSPIFEDLDLLILGGGADVNPVRYGDVPGFFTDKPDLLKEYFDVHRLPLYIKAGVPVFGICRGLQTLAVHFGGRLCQDMWHETNKSEDPYSGVHCIKDIFDPKRKIKVNSRHHQSVMIPRSGSPIKILATYASNITHVEAIRIEGHPIAAVQWHPEDLNEDSGVDYALELIHKYCKR